MGFESSIPICQCAIAPTDTCQVDDDMETRTLRSQQSSFPFSYHVPDKVREVVKGVCMC